MQEGWIDAYTANSTVLLTNIQNQFNCCGFDDTTTYAVPSNCTAVNPGRTATCWSALQGGFVSASVGMGVAALLLALTQVRGPNGDENSASQDTNPFPTQLAAIVVSCCLFQRMPSEGEKEAYLLEEHRRLTKMMRMGGTRL